MGCECRKLVEYSAQQAQELAKATKFELDRRLASFREGIQEGAIEVSARHIYRAGVYLASLTEELHGNPNPRMVLSSLEQRLPSMDAIIFNFFSKYKARIKEQSASVDSRELLRRILRRREKARGLLEANVKRELELAKESLERAKRLDKRVASWGEGKRSEGFVTVIPIVDMHQQT